MKISVVIVTRNRLEDLRVALNGFFSQRYPDKEIIVIDNQSTDGTRECIPAEFPEIKYLWLPDNFDIRGINIGVEMASGDIIWRTDSDSHPETEDIFDNTVEIFKKHPDIDIIAGEDIEVRANYSVWNWYPLPVDKENVPEKGYKANVFHGTVAAIRKKVFDEIGGFWEYGLEESDFSARAILAGFNIRYFPQIRALHYASPSERFPVENWIKISSQMARYNAKYFPFFRMLWRVHIVITMQLLSAIFKKAPLSAILHCFFSMNNSFFQAVRNERNVIPKDKLKDITLGKGILSNYMNYFSDNIRRRVKRIFKK